MYQDPNIYSVCLYSLYILWSYIFTYIPFINEEGYGDLLYIFLRIFFLLLQTMTSSKQAVTIPHTEKKALFSRLGREHVITGLLFG